MSTTTEYFNVYLLTDDFKRDEEISSFVDLRWTDHYNDYGSFELRLNSLIVGERKITKGSYLGANSYYTREVMEIDDILEETDGDGELTYVLTGSCLTKIMENRVAWPFLGPTTYKWEREEQVWHSEELPNGDWQEYFKPEWVTSEENYIWAADGTYHADSTTIVDFRDPNLTDYPEALLTYLWDNFVLKDPIWEDKSITLPYYSKTGLVGMPKGDIPFPADKIAHVQEQPRYVGEVIRELCELYDIGFRLYRLDDQGLVHFDLYMGTDRTVGSGVPNPVIFSEFNNTLEFPRVRDSVVDVKDVAYVYGRRGAAVTSRQADFAELGHELNEWRRRVVLVVDNEDIDPLDDNNPWLNLVGETELLMHQAILDVDGEVNWEIYEYGKDYFLGDLVEFETAGGIRQYVRITEVTFSVNGSGFHIQPGWKKYKAFTPDTWSGWPKWLEWINYDDDERKGITWKSLDDLRSELQSWLLEKTHYLPGGPWSQTLAKTAESVGEPERSTEPET